MSHHLKNAKIRKCKNIAPPQKCENMEMQCNNDQTLNNDLFELSLEEDFDIDEVEKLCRQYDEPHVIM